MVPVGSSVMLELVSRCTQLSRDCIPCLWPFVGKELSPRLFTCAVFFYAVLIVGVPFPFGV